MHTKNILKHAYPFTIMLAASLLTGCASKSPPVDFYTLESSPEETATIEGAANCRDKIIAVGPVSWPRYLDQPRIVTREGKNKLEFNEFNRWAGSLQDDFTRLVNTGLSRLLGSDYITNFSRTARFKPVLRIEIDIRKFDGQLGGDVNLDAKWGIIEQSSGKPLVIRTTSLRQPTSDNTFTSQIVALARMANVLSHEIATELASHACNN